jgi:hypothetical protein
MVSAFLLICLSHQAPHAPPFTTSGIFLDPAAGRVPSPEVQ